MTVKEPSESVFGMPYFYFNIFLFWNHQFIFSLSVKGSVLTKTAIIMDSHNFHWA